MMHEQNLTGQSASKDLVQLHIRGRERRDRQWELKTEVGGKVLEGDGEKTTFWRRRL